MARGSIHLETGTICRAESDETCPYGGGNAGGHAADLAAYADHHGADPETLRGLVENAKMAPKAALELMGSGQMTETPPPATRAPQPRIRSIQEQIEAQARGDENRVRSVQEQLQETPQARYERELTAYKVAMVQHENRVLAEYEAALEVAKQSPFAPQPKQPPFRTVYPKSFEAYDQLPKDFLSEDLPAELKDQAGGAGLWEEYLRKRKQMGDVRHATGKDKIYYL